VKVACAIASLLLATGFVSAQTVTVTLDSSQAGATVSPGATVDWTISFTVSSGDNAGLGLLTCDIIQDGANPDTLDIPPANGVPAPMANFSRPAGISNPGEGTPATGYPGVQRGTAGAMNLIQIGGGQNTFGEALPPGSGVAENATVVGGVGQSGSVILAQGSFSAPGADGDYTFSLANVLANVVTTINTPPTFSPVVSATIDSTGGSFTFSVGGVFGDLNGDGCVGLQDLAALLAAYQGSGVPSPGGDLDNDTDTDLQDLAALLAVYEGPPCP
jgi:hypothetical protein